MSSLASPDLRVAEGQITAAEGIAGIMVVPCSSKRAYTVVDCWVRAIGGSADKLTSCDIQDTTTGTKVAVFTKAGLVENAILRAGTATTGVATNLGTSLGRGQGIKLLYAGTAEDTMTATDYVILYKVEAVDSVT